MLWKYDVEQGFTLSDIYTPNEDQMDESPDIFDTFGPPFPEYDNISANTQQEQQQPEKPIRRVKFKDDPNKNGGIPKSNNLVIVDGASFACTVPFDHRLVVPFVHLCSFYLRV